MWPSSRCVRTASGWPYVFFLILTFSNGCILLTALYDYVDHVVNPIIYSYLVLYGLKSGNICRHHRALYGACSEHILSQRSPGYLNESGHHHMRVDRRIRFEYAICGREIFLARNDFHSKPFSLQCVFITRLRPRPQVSGYFLIRNFFFPHLMM